MKFGEGQKANKNGRPKRKKSMQFGLMSALNAKYGNFDKGMFHIADSLVEIATDPEHPQRLAAIKEISDRLDGKPAQAIIGDNDSDPITVVGALDKELLERYGIK